MQNRDYNLRAVLKFTLPLVLMTLSNNLMFSVDRMVLARYSIDSMNAASLAGNFVSIATFIVIAIAQMAAVFVGQYNGLEEHKKTAWPVWQMIYFSLLSSFLFFVPCGLATEYIDIFPNLYREDRICYQKIIMTFSGLPAISSALSSFFIGRGKSFIVIAVVLLSNIVNFCLDIALVFGIDGVIHSLGAQGAAIATVIGEVVRLLILFVLFLSRGNRANYATNDYRFRKKLFLSCIRTGLPISLTKSLGLFAWFLLLLIFTSVSKDLATIESILVSIWVIFTFFSEGTSRAISALTANLIGQNNLDSILKLLTLFMKLNLIMGLIFAIPLVIRQDISFAFLDQAKGDVAHLYSDLGFALRSLWIIIFVDSIFYSICGVLAAGGDTKFPMYIEQCTTWLLIVLPTASMYFAGMLQNIRVTYVLIPIASCVNVAVIYFRYKEMKWFHRLV
jgi:MATE family multidrug resistance protein